MRDLLVSVSIKSIPDCSKQFWVCPIETFPSLDRTYRQAKLLHRVRREHTFYCLPLQLHGCFVSSAVLPCNQWSANCDR